jgi:hypothetical protein
MAKFYKAILVKKTPEGALNDAYPHLVGTKDMPTLKERLGDAECPDCVNQGYPINKTETRWMLLPDESVAVSQGGKAYIECLDCGYVTHL